MKKILLASAMALSLAACTTGGSTGGDTAAGGAPAGGLINVNISDIRAEVAKNVNVSIENVPITVQLPIAAAAAVCGVDVNLLSVQFNAGNTTCNATTTSADLEQAVRNQMAA
ncbi:MAG TPA: hypothetical protein VHG92_10110 [Afifellaceae bacterium]|nr:hypothetical protein [Afifellaceae bacterium]